MDKEALINLMLKVHYDTDAHKYAMGDYGPTYEGMEAAFDAMVKAVFTQTSLLVYWDDAKGELAHKEVDLRQLCSGCGEQDCICGTTTTIPIDENNLPKGPRWDDEGACYTAEKVNPAVFGCTWYWSARNLKALAKGYQGQRLHPYSPPIIK